MPRRPLLTAVVGVLAGALIGALCTPAPVAALPTIALSSVLVWRAEIGVVIFIVGYGAIVTARLALHGHTFTRIGSRGIEIPPVGRAKAASDEVDTTTDEIAISVAALQAVVDELEERVRAIELPSHLVLSSRDEET